MNIEDKISVAADNVRNDKLRGIMLQGVAHFAALFADAEDDILAAIEAASEAAQSSEDGKEPPITISFAVKLDIGRNKQLGRIAVSIRKTHEAESALPDPSQPELL